MKSEVYTIRTYWSNAYLIAAEAGHCLVDAGSPGEEKKILRRLQQLGCRELRLIFITHAHFDHYGSASAIRRQTGASIAVHSADAEDLAIGRTVLRSARGRGKVVRWWFSRMQSMLRIEPTSPDILLEDGDHLAGHGLDAKVMHTPGHTAGSSALFLRPSTLFAGDLLSATGRPHLQRYFAQDWSSLGSSLARVQAEAPLLVYAGHGRTPIRSEMLQKLGK